MKKTTNDETRIYLDKMMTLPHLPKNLRTSGIPVNVADLSHTGIQSKFNSPIERVLMPNGELHDSYVAKSTGKTRTLSRTLLALQNKKPSYVRSHGRMIDSMLMSMDETKQMQISIDSDILNRTSQLGLSKPSTQQSNSLSLVESKHAKSCGPKPRVKKVYDNKSLFEYLLDSVEPSTSQKKSFASLSRPQTGSDWDKKSLNKVDFVEIFTKTS